MCYSCQILIKLRFPRQIIEKHSNIKCHDNPSSGSPVVPCGRADMIKHVDAFRSLGTRLKTHNSQTFINNFALDSRVKDSEY